MSEDEFPGPRTEREQDVLAFLLTADVEDAAHLRAQSEAVTAIGTCVVEGCPCVNFDVDGSRAPRASVTTYKEVVTAINDPVEPTHQLWVMLWLHDGWLSGIELAWLDYIPPELPSPDELTLSEQ
jgi:hypothetical protein